MTEQQYPLHLRKIGEPVIAQFLEDLMQEMDTHEKMFLELCQVTRERDVLNEIVRGRFDSIENLPASKDSIQVALKIIERYMNARPIGSAVICCDYTVDSGYRFYLEDKSREVKSDV